MGIIVDIGNSAYHFAEFADDSPSCEYAEPKNVLGAPCEGVDFADVDRWLRSKSKPIRWKLGSVNPNRLLQLTNWIDSRNEPYHVVTYRDLPIKNSLQHPEKVGIDRLAAAAAANRLRAPDRPAIVVDAGTAITVDCVSAAGVFLGGTIAPGLKMSMQALNKEAAQLPLSKIRSTPKMIGDSTEPAIQAGVYWLTVGGVDRLLSDLQQELAGPCSMFATGGSMTALLPNLKNEPKLFPHLVLSGLALANS